MATVFVLVRAFPQPPCFCVAFPLVAPSPLRSHSFLNSFFEAFPFQHPSPMSGFTFLGFRSCSLPFPTTLSNVGIHLLVSVFVASTSSPLLQSGLNFSISVFEAAPFQPLLQCCDSFASTSVFVAFPSQPLLQCWAAFRFDFRFVASPFPTLLSNVGGCLDSAPPLRRRAHLQHPTLERGSKEGNIGEGRQGRESAAHFDFNFHLQSRASVFTTCDVCLRDVV